jgi:hypothetical protein
MSAALVAAPASATVTVLAARVSPVRGLLARVAVLLNPYDVRELSLSLDEGWLEVVVAGTGFDADRVAARLEKIVGILEVTRRPG